MAEKEYIERGAVLNAISALAIRITPIEENRDMFYHDSGWNGASVGARVEAGKIPASDVVEVVRCKDCKYWKQITAERHACCMIGFEMEYDEYCSYGERKQ